MKLRVLLLVVLIVLSCLSISYAGEKITLSTFYPAPYGDYDELTVTSLGVDDPSTSGVGQVFTTTNPGELIVEGNVGIGTTGPGAKLDVNGNTRILSSANTPTSGEGMELQYNSGQGEILAYDRTGSAYKSLQLRGSQILLNTGNVGIGTTSPGCKLDVTANTSTWGGWYEAIRFSQAAHSAITHPGGGLLFGLHGNRNFYWADTTNGWYAMTLNANGNLSVRGTLSKGGGSFLIDHVLDPENKVLRHSFVESPEPVLIYKGRAKLVDGKAIIKLPEYFDVLNHPQDREINLTCIGGWSPLYLASEISGNSFIVETTSQGNSQQEFSWIVYGIRNDAFIQKNPIIVEEEKGAGNEFSKGEYLYPEVFNK